MDLDGTILGPSLELTPALIDAVAAAKRSGVEPIIATGRMLRSALPVRPPARDHGAADLLSGRADR